MDEMFIYFIVGWMFIHPIINVKEAIQNYDDTQIHYNYIPSQTLKNDYAILSGSFYC
jgi:hypothetical protein